MISKRSVRVFAPATVANLGSGFDILGLALHQTADEITITESDTPGLRIGSIEGDGGILPKNPDENTCTVAIRSLLEKTGINKGFDISIKKHIALNSGLGSSASSAVAGVAGVNELLGNPFTRTELIPFALDGEFVASKGYHADNVAPGMLGGLTLIRELSPVNIERLPVAADVHLVVLYQYVRVSTAEARQMLPEQYERSIVTRQNARLASLISGILRNDSASIRFGLEDELATPYRKKLIPYFDQLGVNAMKAGATGFNISGSGPTVFAWCESKNVSMIVEQTWRTFMEKTNKPFELYNSAVNAEGVRVTSA